MTKKSYIDRFKYDSRYGMMMCGYIVRGIRKRRFSLVKMLRPDIRPSFCKQSSQYYRLIHNLYFLNPVQCTMFFFYSPPKSGFVYGNSGRPSFRLSVLFLLFFLSRAYLKKIRGLNMKLYWRIHLIKEKCIGQEP